MVDFNNETTIGTPSADVVKILILEKRNNLFEAFEDFMKKDVENIAMTKGIVQARLITLFLELQASLKRKMNEEDYAKLVSDVFGKPDLDKIKEIIYLINEYLDTMGLTKIDTKKQYDTSKTAAEDKEKGFN